MSRFSDIVETQEEMRLLLQKILQVEKKLAKI